MARTRINLGTQSKDTGYTYKNKVKAYNLIDSQLSTPVGITPAPSHGDSYIVAGTGAGDWVGKDGHLVTYNADTTSWDDFSAPVTGDRVIISATPTAGSVGEAKPNYIATYVTDAWVFDAAPVIGDVAACSFSSAILTLGSTAWGVVGALPFTGPGNGIAVTDGLLVTKVDTDNGTIKFSAVSGHEGEMYVDTSTLPASPVFVDKEIPADLTGGVFELDFVVSGDSEHVYLDGILQALTTDYTKAEVSSHTQITFLSVPESNAVILVSYRK